MDSVLPSFTSRMLQDTPFPAPWAQCIIIFLLIYTVTVPTVMVAVIDDLFLSCVITFAAVHTYWTLNEVARDLEDPFVFDPNDLPLARLQVMTGSWLWALVAGVADSLTATGCAGFICGLKAQLGLISVVVRKFLAACRPVTLCPPCRPTQYLFNERLLECGSAIIRGAPPVAPPIQLPEFTSLPLGQRVPGGQRRPQMVS
jgi:Bestrophin, RFP-TM, chloride channel